MRISLQSLLSAFFPVLVRAFQRNRTSNKCVCVHRHTYVCIMCVYVYMCACVHIHTFIHLERERERFKNWLMWLRGFASLNFIGQDASRLETQGRVDVAFWSSEAVWRLNSFFLRGPQFSFLKSFN